MHGAPASLTNGTIAVSGRGTWRQALCLSQDRDRPRAGIRRDYHRAGERVLYQLKRGRAAVRRDLTLQELEEQRHTVIEIAQQAELDESVVAVEPPVSSGLPVPRLITCLPEANRCVCCGTSH